MIPGAIIFLDILSMHMSQTTIAPIYTKKLFPVASFFRTIKIKSMYAQKSKFWMRKGPMSFSFSVSLSFFSLRLFLLFSSFLLQFLAYFWACFQIRNFQKFLQRSSQVYLRETFHQVFSPISERFCAYFSRFI